MQKTFCCMYQRCAAVYGPGCIINRSSLCRSLAEAFHFCRKERKVLSVRVKKNSESFDCDRPGEVTEIDSSEGSPRYIFNDVLKCIWISVLLRIHVFPNSWLTMAVGLACTSIIYVKLHTAHNTHKHTNYVQGLLTLNYTFIYILIRIYVLLSRQSSYLCNVAVIPLKSVSSSSSSASINLHPRPLFTGDSCK